MKRRLRLALVAALALGAGWLGWRSCAPAPEAADVRTAMVERGDLDVTAESSGTVEADGRVEVKSRASGEVVEVTVEAGDPVRAGDLLVRLDPVDEERRVEEARAAEVAARSRTAQAEAGLASARADLADARGRLERRAAALRRGLVSREEHAAAATAVEVSEQAVRQREAEIGAAEADAARAALAVDEAIRRLEETVIKAPADGTVLSVTVEVGSIVSSGITNVGGGTALLTLADLGRLYVVVKLDEAQVGAVRAGQPARIRVDAHPEKVFRGTVERVTPLGVSEANIVTFDVEVRVTDREAGLLLPGMSTDVAIVTERHEGVLLVPSAAIRREAAEGRGDGGLGPARRGRRGSRGETGAAGPGGGTDPAAEAGAAGETAGRAGRPGRARAYVLLASGERRPVETGATNGVLTVVESGLGEGDEIVVSGTPAGAEEGGPSTLRRGMWMLGRGR